MPPAMPAPQPARLTQEVDLFPERLPGGPGVNILPIITPLFPDGSPVTDADLISKYLDHVKGLGADRIFVLGETGEFRFLNQDARHAFTDALLPVAKKLGMRVCLNVTYLDAKETREELERYDSNPNVDALIVVPMYGDNNALIDDCRPQRRLIVYNNPGITNGQNVPEEALIRWAGKVAAIKDSSGKAKESLKLRRICHEINARFFIGSESLMKAHLNSERPGFATTIGAVGSDGSVMRLTALYAQSPEARKEAHPKMMRSINMITNGRRNIVHGIKTALAELEVIIDSRLAPGRASATAYITDNFQLQAIRETAQKVAANDWNPLPL